MPTTLHRNFLFKTRRRWLAQLPFGETGHIILSISISTFSRSNFGRSETNSFVRNCRIRHLKMRVFSGWIAVRNVGAPAGPTTSPTVCTERRPSVALASHCKTRGRRSGRKRKDAPVWTFDAQTFASSVKNTPVAKYVAVPIYWIVRVTRSGEPTWRISKCFPLAKRRRTPKSD
jgi:hypothetical protein